MDTNEATKLLERRIYEVTIYLKSGASFTIDAHKFTVIASDQLSKLRWEIPQDTDDHSYRALSYICLEDISAIVMR